jgi:hypothetical protein
MSPHTDHVMARQDTIEIAIWSRQLPKQATIVDLPFRAIVHFTDTPSASSTATGGHSRKVSDTSSITTDDISDSPRLAHRQQLGATQHSQLSQQGSSDVQPTNLIREVLFDSSAVVQDLMHILLPTVSAFPQVSSSISHSSNASSRFTPSHESMLLMIDIPSSLASANSKPKTVILVPSRKISSYFSVAGETTVCPSIWAPDGSVLI